MSTFQLFRGKNHQTSEAFCEIVKKPDEKEWFLASAIAPYRRRMQ